MANLVSSAIIWATFSHENQKDKGGKSYIDHPFWVMSQFQETELRIGAVLHDVVEDSETTLEEVVEVFGTEIGDIVDHLTRRPNELYREFIERCGHSVKATKIKLMDLRHNMSRWFEGKGDLNSRYKRATAYLITNAIKTWNKDDLKWLADNDFLNINKVA